MTAIERVLVLRLLERQEKNPEFIKKIGVQVKVSNRNDKSKNGGHVSV